MKRFLSALMSLALCFIMLSAETMTEFPVNELGTEYVPLVETNDGEYFYVYANQMQTELKLVEPIGKHADFLLDGFTSYRNVEDFDVPPYLTINGRKCNVVAIESGMFCNPIVRSVKIPSTVFVIEGNTFYSADLRELTLSEGLRSIMKNAFCRTKLNNLLLPQSLYEIQNGCFTHCEIENISLPDNLYYIGDDCFTENPLLEEIVLPSMLTELGNGCFNGCSALKKVTLPKFCGAIQDSFNECKEIELIICEAKTPLPIIDSFKDVDKAKCRVIIPDGCMNNYLVNNDDWKEFNLIEKSAASIDETMYEVQHANAVSSIFSIEGFKLLNEKNIETGKPYIKVESDNSYKILIRK